MADHQQDIEKIILTRLTRMNAVVSGIMAGSVLGGAIFLATIFLVLKGGEVVGPHLALLGQFFYGYTVTLGGSFIGLAYGFVVGFIIGYVVARLYNWFAELRESRRG